jgi:valyl-tRNA synthetase
MMGEYALEEIPFQKAFIHGLIYGKSYWREEEGVIHYVSKEEKENYDKGQNVPKDVFSRWEKMSKSKGNVIDPIEIINLYGTDAMRIALCSSATNARQIDLDLRRFEEYKNFANKIWNATRFIFLHLSSEELPCLEKQIFSQGLDFSIFTLEDKWILSRLNRTIDIVNKNLEDLSFDKASVYAYEFFWNEFCSYYLELIKPSLYGKTNNNDERLNRLKLLVVILSNSVRLLHPFAPFITEEIFSLLKTNFGDIKADNQADIYTTKTLEALNSEACIVSPFPELLKNENIDETVEEKFSLMKKIVYSIRNIRSEMQVPLSMKTDVYIQTKGNNKEIVEKNKQIILSLIKCEKIIFLKEEDPIPPQTTSSLVEETKIFVSLPEELLLKEKNRLKKEKEKLEKNLSGLKIKLNNQSFLEKAPSNVVENLKKTFLELENKLIEIENKIK